MAMAVSEAVSNKVYYILLNITHFSLFEALKNTQSFLNVKVGCVPVLGFFIPSPLRVTSAKAPAPNPTARPVANINPLDGGCKGRLD